MKKDSRTSLFSVSAISRGIARDVFFRYHHKEDSFSACIYVKTLNEDSLLVSSSIYKKLRDAVTDLRDKLEGMRLVTPSGGNFRVKATLESYQDDN